MSEFIPNKKHSPFHLFPFRFLLLGGVICFICFTTALRAQTSWDTNAGFQQLPGFRKVNIPSTADMTLQPAWFCKSHLGKGQPLIVSLHTWSGNYDQQDPLAAEALLRGWNYIHPDFRGANTNPGACGSENSVTDLDDAIRWSVKESEADPLNVHVIGVSGGGHAALMAWLKLSYPVKSFHAWVPVTDLPAWYGESQSRNNRYAKDLEQVAGTDQSGKINFSELKKRSPLYIPALPGNRHNASLHLYAGIHDGYTGSVPVTHTLNFFNRMAKELYPYRKELPVSCQTILNLVTRRSNPGAALNRQLGGRNIHLEKHSPRLHLTVFEGGHEMLSAVSLSLTGADPRVDTSNQYIVTIGDSNGAAPDGWPRQLQAFFPGSSILNLSVSGNTIGYDNLGKPELNTLRTIHTSLDSASLRGSPGMILLGTGTNDAKKIYAGREEEITRNLDSLFRLIQLYYSAKRKPCPRIVMLAIPPVEELKADTVKYGGIGSRITILNERFRELCRQRGIGFIDTHPSILKACEPVTSDGIHLTTGAQFRTAEAIAAYFIKNR